MTPNSLKSTFFLAVVLASTPSHATWSVATLNKKTGTIAVAGASCSYMVYGIAQVLPGKGAVIVQAASNEQARSKAVAMLEQDASLTTILESITDVGSAFEPAQQQYALLSFEEYATPLTFTGSEVSGAKGSVSGPGYSVQANTMVSDSVVANTAKALGAGDWSSDLDMARAVMRAMNAGAKVGGDSRCKGSDSTTAFISLYKRENNPNVPWLTLAIFGMEAGTRSAMGPLNQAFEHWIENDAANPSTRTFVIPRQD